MGTSVNNMSDIQIKEEVVDKTNEEDEEIENLEWSPDQEILLLYSLHGLKPVGPHKHFRMIRIQERLSNALSKKISSNAIWKKLNMWYDLEALDEAEAEADEASNVKVDFELPQDEYGAMIELKIKGLPIKVERNDDSESVLDTTVDLLQDIKVESDTLLQGNDFEVKKEVSELQKGLSNSKDNKKESVRRGLVKKQSTPVKDNILSKKENLKKDTPSKREVEKKGTAKEDVKKDSLKKGMQETEYDTGKEEKKEVIGKGNKRETIDKRQQSEQTKKETEFKKSDQKRLSDTSKSQRIEAIKPRPETPKQQRTETPKRTDTKTRSETPKPQKIETPKAQRIETAKKESSGDKKKEAAEKKTERKSPEKTPELPRSGKLRTRERRETESEKPETPTGTKRERSKEMPVQVDEPPAKKAKTPAVKGRPTRNSTEPSTPTPSPQKRRTRMH